MTFFLFLYRVGVLVKSHSCPRLVRSHKRLRFQMLTGLSCVTKVKEISLVGAAVILIFATVMPYYKYSMRKVWFMALTQANSKGPSYVLVLCVLSWNTNPLIAYSYNFFSNLKKKIENLKKKNLSLIGNSPRRGHKREKQDQKVIFLLIFRYHYWLLW